MRYLKRPLGWRSFDRRCRSYASDEALAGQLAYEGLNRHAKPGNHGQHTINLQAAASLCPRDC
jgi:hypothetical protein